VALEKLFEACRDLKLKPLASKRFDFMFGEATMPAGSDKNRYLSSVRPAPERRGVYAEAVGCLVQ
jgi:hypothetical protein